MWDEFVDSWQSIMDVVFNEENDEDDNCMLEKDI